MTLLRHYRMQAAEGRSDDLKAALTALAGQVAPLAGCEKVEMFADPDDASIIIFIEYWRGIDDHKAAGAALGKAAFGPVMAALASPPQGCYLEPLLTLGAAA